MNSNSGLATFTNNFFSSYAFLNAMLSYASVTLHILFTNEWLKNAMHCGANLSYFVIEIISAVRSHHSNYDYAGELMNSTILKAKYAPTTAKRDV